MGPECLVEKTSGSFSCDPKLPFGIESCPKNRNNRISLGLCVLFCSANPDVLLRDGWVIYLFVFFFFSFSFLALLAFFLHGTGILPKTKVSIYLFFKKMKTTLNKNLFFRPCFLSVNSRYPANLLLFRKKIFAISKHPVMCRDVSCVEISFERKPEDLECLPELHFADDKTEAQWFFICLALGLVL